MLTEKLEKISAYNTVIAENQTKVYEAGVRAGLAQNPDYEGSFEEGKKAGIDSFWRNITYNVDTYNHGSYNYMFQNVWHEDMFSQNVVIAPKLANNMFSHSLIKDARKIKLDFSKCTSVDSLFEFCKDLTHIGLLDMRSIQYTPWFTFLRCEKLKSIEKIILPDNYTDETVFGIYEMGFYDLVNLEDITIEGSIAQGLNLSACKKLSKASIESFLTHLNTTYKGGLTLPKDTVEKYWDTEDENGEWHSFVMNTNWTISLI